MSPVTRLLLICFGIGLLGAVIGTAGTLGAVVLVIGG